MADSLHKVEQQLYEHLERKYGAERCKRAGIPVSKPLSASEQWEKELEQRYNWSETMRPKRRWWNFFGIFG